MQQRVSVIHQCISILFEPVSQQLQHRIRLQFFCGLPYSRIIPVGNTASRHFRMIIAIDNLVIRSYKACNAAGAVQNIVAGHADFSDVVAVPDDMPVLRSADNAACIVLCSHRTRIVAFGNDDMNGRAVAACRQMSDDTADRTVTCRHGTDVITALDDAIPAVAHGSDNTAAPTVADDIRTVPAIDKVCAVAPPGNAAHPGKVVRTDFAACNTDILDHRIGADISEQSSGR